MREEATVFVSDFYWEEPVGKKYQVISKSEIDLFPTKHLLAQKTHGLSFDDDKSYILFNTRWVIKKAYGLEYYKIYAANVKDFREVLNSREHVPNKKEGKAIRQAAAKKGR